MKAKIARIQIDIDYRCPNCYLHFRLSNSKIPQGQPISYHCVECSEPLSIPSPFKSKKITKSKTKDPVVNKAILSLKAMGFKPSEATTLVNRSYCSGIDVANLVKEAIKNVEPTKTNTT